MDHAHHRAAGRAAGHVRSLSISVASELCRGRRRDRAAAAGIASAVAGAVLYGAQCRGARDPHPRREPRALRHRRNARAHALHERPAGSTRTPGGNLGRLPADVPRHVHGDPRHPGGGDVAADDPARARHLARCDELDPDRLSDRRGDRDPSDRAVHARAELAVAVRVGGHLFTLASIGCAFSGSFAVLLVSASCRDLPAAC